MKQIITHYERELVECLLQQARQTSQLLDMIHRSIEHVLLVEEGDNAVHFHNWINSIADGEDQLADCMAVMCEELGITVADPLTEEPDHVEPA